jgi:hypothetical protein
MKAGQLNGTLWKNDGFDQPLGLSNVVAIAAGTERKEYRK